MLATLDSIELDGLDEESVPTPFTVEPCPICDLHPAGPCAACNGRGFVTYDA